MAAVAAAIGTETLLACHVGDDLAGAQMRQWADTMQIELLAGKSRHPTVSLIEALSIEGEGVIVEGSIDPGPGRLGPWTGGDINGVVALGHVSAGAIKRSLSLCMTAPFLLLNMSAAYAEVGHRASALWRRANLVTIREDELARFSQLGNAVVTDTVLAVTNGPHAVEIRGLGENRRFLPFPVPRVLDTMGAGDAFAITLGLWLSCGHSMESSVSAALESAARMCLVDDAFELRPGDWQDLDPRLIPR